MDKVELKLQLLPQIFCVCRLNADAQIPEWAIKSSIFSITRTPTELSIVCQQDLIPDGIRVESDWRMLAVVGPLDFSLTGIMAALATPLAQAKISLFAIATYDTDYVMVKADKLAAAIAVLKHSHQIIDQP